tara:strand:- start:36 stop:317 length:282 start_codon:yes stop_codon:yes gene_type:complete
MSNNTEKFTYTRDRLLKVLVSAYNQGFLDGTKKRNSLDDLQFLADHEIGHAKAKETLLSNKAADYMTNSEKRESLPYGIGRLVPITNEENDNG